MVAETRLFLCLSDNYGVLLHDPESGATASIDAPEAAPIEAALKETHGNRRKAAEVLGIGERTLYRKIKQYAIV